MTISTIIPAFNREAILPLTLRSILQQDIGGHEVIVVDDGSEDNTAETAKACGNEIQVLQQENAGPAAARNHGFQKSTGDLIHFFDSDDLAAHNKLAIQSKALEQSGADIAFGPWVKGSFSNNRFTPENHVYQAHGLPEGDLIRSLLTAWSIIPHACLFRRSIVEQSGGFPEELFVGEDQLMFLRCLLAGAKVINTPETLTLYRCDNTDDKLSGSESGDARRKMHWARFLLMARRECLEHAIEPLDWRGYRQRLWQAKNDLTSIAPEEEAFELSKEIEVLIGKNRGLSFRFNRWKGQKMGGLRQRLKGHREGGAFKMAPMSEHQLMMAQDLFPKS